VQKIRLYRVCGRNRKGGAIRTVSKSRVRSLSRLFVRMFSVSFCLTLLVGVASAQARSLYWDAMEVTAHLDADGSLHVTEHQEMVFDGAWNGGERDFNIPLGQRVQLIGLWRIDPGTGSRIGLTQGPLAAVDQYKWVNDHALRWRSRLPRDPVFHKQKLVYEIEYRYFNVLVPRRGGYWLDYDFAFRRRPGEFRHYSLNFTMDPVWIAPYSFNGNQVRENLRPGQGMVARVMLRYVGPGQPAAVIRGTDPRWVAAMLVLFVVFVLWRFRIYLGHERRNGRFAPLPDPATIDEAWLQREVFSQLPEKIGAQWDERTGAAEVAAILARLVQEGKLESHVEERGVWIFKRKVLCLKLLQPLDQFGSYEHKLLKSLFIDGDKTDTDKVRSYYRKKKTGFDPASKIRTALKPGEKTDPDNKQALQGAWRLTAVLVLGAAVAFVAALRSDFNWIAVLMPFAGIAIANAITVRLMAVAARAEVEHPGIRLGTVLAPAFLLAALVSVPLFWFYRFVPLPAWPGVVLVFAAIINSAFNGVRTRVSPEQIARRKRLCGARRYFVRELGHSEPHLRDEWYPYLIAFGLNREMDRWFRSYASSTGGTSGFGTAASSGSGMSSAGWSGGGGSFGGAGAVAGWAAAAGTLSAGVASPSSGGGGGSSGGGGGSSGGGGGSSGGGGGGGW
jgi:uncharacterized membrane protein YgcG